MFQQWMTFVHTCEKQSNARRAAFTYRGEWVSDRGVRSAADGTHRRNDAEPARFSPQPPCPLFVSVCGQSQPGSCGSECQPR
jgi:hypothetical protein